MSKWRERPARPPSPPPPVAEAPAAPSTPGKRIVPSLLIIGAVVLAIAVVAAVFLLLRKPDSDAVSEPESTLPEPTTQALVDTCFDLELKLDGSPLGLTYRGADMILTNRVEPWGLIVARHRGGELIEQAKQPVIESNYHQQIGLTTITWNGTYLVGITDSSWVEADTEDVFVLLDPDSLSIDWWYPAPPRLGGLVWNGDGYWAATRRNTETAREPAYLYRLDTDLDVVERFPPPAVGCQGLAVHQNLLYFADVFSGTVTVLDTSVRPPRVVERLSTGLDYLSGIAHDGEHLWVTEYAGDQLLRIARQTLASAPRPPVRYALQEATLPPDDTDAPAADRRSLGELRAALRSDDAFERLQAEDELRRRGAQPDFDREENLSPETGPEDASILWWQAEMRRGTITASWEIFFGHALFSQLTEHRDGPVTVPLFVRYTIEVEGGDLGQPVQLDLPGQPGVQTINDQVLASDLGRGTYRISLFLHVQYVQPGGGAKISNTPAFPLEVGW